MGVSDVIDKSRFSRGGSGGSSGIPSGEIRLQFWRDAIESILPADPYSEPRRPRMPPNQPVVSSHARHSAHHLGLAEGMVTILRGLPINARQGHISLPRELLDKHKLTPRSLLHQASTSTEADESLRSACLEVADLAESHLENCRFRSDKLTTDQRLIMLPAVAVHAYLTMFHKVNGNVLSPKLKKSNPLLPLKLCIIKFRGT